MSVLSRRDFLAALGLGAGALAAGDYAHLGLSGVDVPDVAAIDRGRILRAAGRYLPEQPVTITAFSSPRSAGGKHDYFSEGDYWWPDPKNPSGPYIRRDGLSNPGNFTAHRHALIRLSLQVPALAAAWLLTHEGRYAEHAAAHLRAWFLNPSTRMNANLQYAQAIHGVTVGRGIGIIDTIQLVEPVRAIPFLQGSGALTRQEIAGLRTWFADYLDWLTASKNGQEERAAKNNHGTCWVMQAAEFARFTGRNDVPEDCRRRLKTDARGIITTYSYDALNRLTSKSYSDGTPSATYNYDESSAMGVNLANTIGRKSSESTAGTNSTGAVFSYDSMGRVANNSQCTPQNCGAGVFPFQYSQYDYAGELITATDAMGVTYSYTYSNAARLLSLTSSLSDANHPASLLSGAKYDAWGTVTSANWGNGTAEALSYDKRTRLQSISTSGFTGGSGSVGSVSVSGSEQDIPAAPAASGTGSVTFSGSLQSKQVLTKAATSGTGSVAILGSEQSITTCEPNCITVYDSGTVNIFVNGFEASASYGSSSTASSIASALATALNASGSPVTATLSGSTVNLTAKTTGASTNYSLSSSSTYRSSIFSSPSFTGSPSGSSLTGGANAVYNTIYDSGTSTITVNGHADTVSWSGSGTTSSSIASSLASAINGDSGAYVSASASASTVNLTAKVTGASTNYSLSSSSTYDSTDFSGPSFTSSNSGSTLTGGHDAGVTVYDSGSVWITVNGTQYSVSYGQSSTSTSVASALAQAINGSSGSPVTATASGSTVNLASNALGSSTNYSLSAGSSTNQGSSFLQPSFSASASGSTMTGGTDSSPTTVYSLSLGYAANSDVTTTNDSVNGNWTYSYDEFNRVTGSNQNGGQAVYTYAYDRFGNRWQQNGPNSMTLSFTGNNPSSPQNNNRMDGYSYDASGNLLNDGVHAYTYDAESRIISVDGGNVTYVYDAEGRRARKTVSGASVDYLYDLSGNQVAEVSSSGAFNREEIYIGARHLATYAGGAGGTTYFAHGDHIATERARTNMFGEACETITSLPFGDGQATSGGCGDPSPMHFTGKPRDTETNLDDFDARYYSSRFGRFISADWSAVPVAVPYANFTNPQTLNLYAIVHDNPETFADLDGHAPTQQTEQPNPKPAGCETLDCPGPSDMTLLAQDQHNQPAPPQSAYQKYVNQQNQPISDADKLGALSQAGQIAQPGVNAAIAVGAIEAAPLIAAVAVEVAPAVAAGGEAAVAAADSASASIYVRASTAAGAAGTAINNAYAAGVQAVRQGAVAIDALRSGGGAVKAAGDFIQGVASKTSTITNVPGAAGRAIRIAYEIGSKLLN